MSDIAARPGDADSASIGRTRLGGYQLIRRIGAGPLAAATLARCNEIFMVPSGCTHMRPRKGRHVLSSTA